MTAILAADFSAIWDLGNGNWDDSFHWSTNPTYPNNTGGVTYDATINGGTVTLDQNITIQRLFLNVSDFSSHFASLLGASGLTLYEGLTWTNGAIGNSISNPTINLVAGSTSTISTVNGGGFLTGVINNFGIITQTTGDFDFTGTINNSTGATWNFQGIGINNPRPFYVPGVGGTFNNSGNVVVSPTNINSGRAGVSILTNLNNTGNITIQAPATGIPTTFTVGGNGSGSGSFSLGADTILEMGSYTFNAGATITGAGQTWCSRFTIAGDTSVSTDFQNFGVLMIQKGATLTLTGTFNQPAPPPLQTGGTTRLNGGTITSAQPLNFGQNTNLTGSGTINGSVISNATISPGASAGTLTINGNVALLNNSKLVMEIGGLTQGTQYDHLAIGGMVTLDGTLELRMLNGFQLQLDPSQTFTLLTSKDVLSGVFDNVANGTRLTTVDGLASFQVNYGAGSPYGANNLVLSDPQGVPEPASLILFAGGAMVLGFTRRCRR